MKHGGDLLSYKEYYEGDLIDFSSNINPLGYPQGLEEEMNLGFESLKAYPDIQYRKLKESVAEYLGCTKDNIVLGNGSVELIDNFIFLAKRVILCTPSFSEYELRAAVHGKELVRIPYNEDFTLKTMAIENHLEEGDMLILGNPNNPTGLRIKKEELLNIYSMVNSAEAFLLLDEAFFEFCPRDYDSIELFKSFDYDRVSILRASTKFFALAGIRLGYGCASKSMASMIAQIQLPWSINSLAEIAGRFIFKDKNYIEKSKTYIEIERKYLLEELSKVKGIQVFHSHTNFILIKLYAWKEEEAFLFFLRRGIVVRKCSSFVGLEENYIRIAVKDRESNERLLGVFRKLEKEKDFEEINPL
ncbi:MAG: aminotransferase class I/II-fold pyridoxal phosphate-dependent enzyme [Tissierellia bacterium]|jgi:threonine-phosphate decarboxylase|nr:aminotransferase class I/II-fold pyridoxal phosphate-dependent enzyme [Tissierellia bacterium]